jgi:PAS domain S-box-containing protein
MADATDDRLDAVQAWGISKEELTAFSNSDDEQKELYKVLQSRPYYVSNNLQREFISEHWKGLAAVAGYGSCMVLPVKRSGSRVGSFNLYASEADFFTADKTTLLQDAASAISFALDVFEKEKQKLLVDQQLKHKERRLSQAQAIAHLGSWELDLATNISVWSDEACRIFGLSEADNMQSRESWLSFIHPEDLDYVVRTTQDAVDSLQAADYYYRIVRNDGQIRYLHAQAHIELNTKGQPVTLYGVLQDVTEIEKSKQALKGSESNLCAIFENTSEGFILTDTHAIVKYFNGKASYFYKLSTGSEIRIGASLFDAVSEDRVEQCKQTVACILAGNTRQDEYVYEQLNGQKKWLSITFAPVYENQQNTGLSLTMMDITDQKLAQDLLQK